jgi:hypothetical protein
MTPLAGDATMAAQTHAEFELAVAERHLDRARSAVAVAQAQGLRGPERIDVGRRYSTALRRYEDRLVALFVARPVA